MDGIYVYGLVYTNVFPCSQILIKRLRSKDIPVAMSTPSSQILLSNIVLQSKELKLLGEMADRRIE